MTIEKIERKVLRLANQLIYNGKSKEKDLPIMPSDELNRYIYDGLKADKPFMVARFGSIELDAALYPYLCGLPLMDRYKLFSQKRIQHIRYHDDYAQFLVNPLCNNAGFFPNDISLLDRFSKVYTDAAGCCCCCCVNWNREDLMMPFFSQEIRFARLDDMEPYDYPQPWSKALEGKKVLVIHPFAKTIESQYLKRELLWENKDVLPEFELKTLKAVQTLAGEISEFETWFDALEYMENQIDAIDFDIAIIGCGAYGFPLAAYCKKIGKKAVHLGGATQILFGIKGKRWDENPAVSKFYNEHWVRPLPEETPRQNKKVEGGCYW